MTLGLLMTLDRNSVTNERTNGQTDNTKSRVAFATENKCLVCKD